MPGDKVHPTVRHSTSIMSGAPTVIPTTKKEADAEAKRKAKEAEAAKKKQKKENDRKKKEAARQRDRHSKGRSSRTKSVEKTQEANTYNHITDMGQQNYNTDNATTCGVKGMNPVKVAARRIIGKAKK